MYSTKIVLFLNFLLLAVQIPFLILYLGHRKRKRYRFQHNGFIHNIVPPVLWLASPFTIASDVQFSGT